MPFANLAAVLAEATPVGRRFVDAGHKVYLVGGIVRDLWLDRPVAEGIDLDLTTDAVPAETRAVIEPVAEALWLQGERFGTVGARIAGRAYEITTHRSEAYGPDSRKPAVAFSTAVDQDLARRDFTVNAMAVELPGGTLIDPHGGVADLEARRLRTPLDPDTSFTDDPLRMLRAARFAAGYDLEPVPELIEAIGRLSGRIDIVSAERIRDELDKLLLVDSPHRGLVMLERTGVLGRVLPEARVTADIDRFDTQPELRLAALLAHAALADVRVRLRRLRYSNARREWTVRVLEAAAAVADRPVDPPDYRRWHDAVGDARDEAHAVAMIIDPTNASIIGEMETTRLRLGGELDDFSLPVDGDDVKALLGVSEGTVVGEALAHLRDLRFDAGPLDSDAAAAALHHWWSDRTRQR